MHVLKWTSILSLLASAALAEDYRAGDLTIEHPWSRPAPPNAATAAGFLTIRNAGSEPDRLVSVVSSIAETVEIHESSIIDGVAQMKRLPDLEIGVGGTIESALYAAVTGCPQSPDCCPPCSGIGVRVAPDSATRTRLPGSATSSRANFRLDEPALSVKILSDIG